MQAHLPPRRGGASSRRYALGMVLTGLDVLAREGFGRLRGRRVGLVCNPASVSRGLDHALDLMLGAGVDVVAAFGPQHGLVGSTQDNMIEWEGGRDARTGVPVHSLYGEVRRPTPEMLAGLDLLVVDLPDVGSRYYTFVWTACLCLEACAEAGVEVLVLDRPNPLGSAVEGPVLEPAFASFVGLHPVPTRHGLTIGGVARLFARERGLPRPGVVKIEGEGEAPPWISPSPNMPTLDTAFVYPGGCLLEGTNLSEGRGTCRPFETVGAPFLPAYPFAEALNALDLPGVRFRPVEFEPTFNKHAGRLCGGVFVHVLDRAAFRPVLAYVAVLQEAIRLSGFHEAGGSAGETFRTDSPEVALPGFAWKLPPYEYVRDRAPIDLLFGNAWMRPLVQGLAPLGEIRDRMDANLNAFLTGA